MNRLRADALLLLVAFIFGTTFIAQNNANASMGPVLFVGIKFFLATLALTPFVFYEAKKQIVALNWGDYAVAGAIGICLFTGSSLQQIGLLTTTVSNAGFLTALYVVIVPFVVWLLKRKERPRPIVLIACLISITGAWLLADNGQAKKITLGDGLVVIADVAWATGIALVPVFLKRTNRPFLLSFLQFGITAILGITGGLIFEPITEQGIITALPAILYAGIMSGGIAYTLGVIAQRHTPAAEAALIVSLESVFAAIAAAILLHERLTWPALTGCILILLGVIIVEIGPLLSRNQKMIKDRNSETEPDGLEESTSCK